jgi:hypothetical protein
MSRLRLARPDFDVAEDAASPAAPRSKSDAGPPQETVTFPVGSNTHANADAKLYAGLSPASRRSIVPFPRRSYWSAGAAAAALTLCGWAGWKAGAPGPSATARQTPGGSASQSGPSDTQSPAAAAAADGDGNLEFLPALESRQHLLSVKDLGVFRDSRQRPVQLMSATWLDENTYGGTADPELRESRVRHEIVPVVLPTY